jgi:hypothetical protein
VAFQRYKDPISVTHPNIAARVSADSPLQPSAVTAGSLKKLLWNCGNGYPHSFSAPVQRMVGQGVTCAVCSGKQILPGFNDLGTTDPGLARSLLPEESGFSAQEVGRGSHRRGFWWCTDGGHAWDATVNNVVNGQRCRFCYGRGVLPGTNDVGTLHPDVASEYSTNNPLPLDHLSRAAADRVLWSCRKCAYEYRAALRDRTRADGKATGCPRCSGRSSQLEQDILEYVRTLCPTREVQHAVRSLVPSRPGLELDIYLPELQIGIEVNGVVWHSEPYKTKNDHRDKVEAFASLGIQILTVWEDDWRDRSAVVKRMLAHKLGASREPRVYARSTSVRTTSHAESAAFLEQHHIQGSARGRHYLSLVDSEGVVVAIMVLQQHGRRLTLARYATSCVVPGGQGKLLSWVQRNLDFDILVTFADREVSSGELYEKTGWRFDGTVRPDYKYLVGSRRVHKFNYRKSRFRDDPTLMYEEGMTEAKLADLNGLRRSWDSGKIRYVMPKKQA